MAQGQPASSFRQLTTSASIHARNGLTMMGWTRLHAVGGYGVFWGCENTIPGRLGFLCPSGLGRTPWMQTGADSTGTPVVYPLIADPYPVMTAEAYHHLAFTVSGGANATGVNFMTGYFDGGQGARQRSDFYNFDTQIIPTLFYVGTNDYAVAAYHQNIRAWNRVLTPGEIRREMWSRFPVNRQALLIDLPLMVNGDILDRAQQNKWTLTGAAFDFEVGPILGGPPNPLLYRTLGSPAAPAVSSAGQPWSSVWRPARV